MCRASDDKPTYNYDKGAHERHTTGLKTGSQGEARGEARDGRDRSGFAYASRDDLVRPSCSQHLLDGLIDWLDSQRAPTQPKNGGLHRCLMDDGRWLWLCPDHYKESQRGSG